METVTHRKLMEKIRQIDSKHINDDLKIANIQILINKYYNKNIKAGLRK